MPNTTYLRALNRAIEMMMESDLEPTSAIKQAGSDEGIPYGPEMGAFHAWAMNELYNRG